VTVGRGEERAADLEAHGAASTTPGDGLGHDPRVDEGA
jgi:hypothetical protein